MLPEPIDNLAPGKGSYYGIDLGTTYTVIARIEREQIAKHAIFFPVKVMTIEQHSPLPLDGSDASDMIASVLAVDDQNKMYVGNKLYRLKGHPSFVKDKNLFYHWKLDLGVSQKPLYPDAARTDVDDAAKVAGKILNYCRMQLHPQSEWENVIITVPASFQANQRSDVLMAASYAKIKTGNNMLVDEPNAAFVGYLNQLTPDEKALLFAKKEATVLVIDFGGGTCDLSILNVRPSEAGIKIANIAISRYNDLGGQDIDLLLAERWLLPQFNRVMAECDVRVLEDQVIPQLAVMAEKLKIDLSRTISATLQEYDNINIDSLESFKSVLTQQIVVVDRDEVLLDEISLNGAELYQAIHFIFQSDEYKLELADKVIQSVPSTIFDILQKGNLAKTDIDFVMFAGGSVQNLLFIHEVSRIFSQARVLLPRRPDTLVAQGAAIISFYRNALGYDPILPIAADTIGVVTSDTNFLPIIKAGTALPCDVELPSFMLQHLFQQKVVVPLCLGNAENVIQILEIDLPNHLDFNTTITIRAHLTVEKVFKAEVKNGALVLGQMEVTNPFVLANSSPAERMLTQKLAELEKVTAARDRNKEREVMRALIWEYYNLNNYSKAAFFAEEWIKKFDRNDASVYNMVYCAYDNLGQRRKAKEYLDRALEFDPDNSTLCYNKSLVINKEEGVKAALEYLESRSERVRNSTSVFFRLALLGLNLDHKEYAQKVADNYKNKIYDDCSDFNLRLLKKILEQLGIEYVSSHKNRDNSSSIGYEEWKGDLLKMKDEIRPA